jgi:hypothetical protein
MVELTTMPAPMRSRASTGGDVSNVVAITAATAAFFMASSYTPRNEQAERLVAISPTIQSLI